MERKCLNNPHHHPQQQQTPINLKNLPPINPPSSSKPSYQVVKKSKEITRYVPKVAKPRPEEEEEEEEEGLKVVKFDHEANTEADLLADQQRQNDVEDASSVCCIKHIDSNFIKNTSTTTAQSKSSSDDKGLVVESGEAKRVSAKSQLHEICVAYNWKPPVYERCKEEGPCHRRLFTYKVVVEIKVELGAETESTDLECYGVPKPKKKTAAEHAAEGALWYLKHLGHFPIKKEGKLKNKK